MPGECQENAKTSKEKKKKKKKENSQPPPLSSDFLGLQDKEQLLLTLTYL